MAKTPSKKKMQLWRARILQLPSGYGQRGLFDDGEKALPRKPASLNEVMDTVSRVSEVYYGYRWKVARQRGTKNSPIRDEWIAGAIGKWSTTPDMDDWTEEGWEFDVDSKKLATEFLIHIPSRTLYIRDDKKVAQKPITVIARLQILLNKALQETWPESEWVLRIEIEKNVDGFMEVWDSIDVVEKLTVTMFIPNGDGAEFLYLLQGQAGKAGAERVQVELKSEKGIDKRSLFVMGALELLRSGLAKIKVSGKTKAMPGDSQYKQRDRSADSDRKADVVPHYLQSRHSTLQLGMSDAVMDAVGTFSSIEPKFEEDDRPTDQGIGR